MKALHLEVSKVERGPWRAMPWIGSSDLGEVISSERLWLAINETEYKMTLKVGKTDKNPKTT